MYCFSIFLSELANMSVVYKKNKIVIFLLGYSKLLNIKSTNLKRINDYLYAVD